MSASNRNRHTTEEGQQAVVTLCSQCKPDGFADDMLALRDALTRAGLTVDVRGQECLNCCEAPQALALHGPGRATYVFHDLEIAGDLQDIVATVRTWLDAEEGWIVDAQGCGRLRFCLRARLAAT